MASVKRAKRKPVSSAVESRTGVLGREGWPAARRVLEAVCPYPAAHRWLFLVQVPFWNGCNEDEHCVPDLLLDARSDLPTAM